MLIPSRLAIGLIVLLINTVSVGAQEIDFNRDVRPILSENCYFCHGPDDQHRDSDLRLDVEADAHDYAIEPGSANDSLVIERVTADDSDELMPPPESGKSLSAEQIDLLKRWIDSGAKFDEHWSFVKPKKVETPAGENSIDYLVGKRLKNAGLEFASPASKETLIRRVTFDLTGLPPTIAEIDAFLDDKSDDAFAVVVDRLLASPHYGQRMAADWLDVARYSDTYGYQVDRDRRVWPWRDWVVRSFNENKPYKQFLIEQIAGDLLADATDDQVLATTFNRLHPQKVEGGSVPEEFRIEYVADRMQTFGTAVMGLTMECCRCHNHKFDPISQKEFFQLTAYFDNIEEAGLYSYFTSSVPTPTLMLPNDGQKKKLAELKLAVENAEAELTRIAVDEEEAFKEAISSEPKELETGEIEQLLGQIKLLDFEGEMKGANQSVDGKFGKGIKLTGDDAVNLDVGNFKRSDPFSVSLWLNSPDEKERAVVFHRSRAWTDAASRGYQLLIEDGRLSFSLVHFMPGNAITVMCKEKLPINAWQHAVVTYDGSSRADGVQIYVNGQRAQLEVVRDNLYKNITGGGGDNIAIGERFRDKGFKNGLVDDFKVFNRELTWLEAAKVSGAVPTVLPEEAKKTYLHVNSEAYKKALGELQSKRAEYFKLQDSIQEIMVMRESKPKKTFVLDRGVYDSPTDEVSTAIPEALAINDASTPANRLELAQWATHKDHPLTSRVAVNRVWQMLFGEGLVRTPEDFGSQGEPPTHPDLLDYLAVDFSDNGWDVKKLLKKIVLSKTYQQSSAVHVNDAGETVDPENRLLARGPSYRLSAEMLRDGALAISGLLVDKMGGPPVKPYEISESFKPATPDKGEGLYRRSLYTYWKRTGPAPAMMTLDAAKRDVCRMKRERTSSPLASLVLMNGPQYVEAGRATAARLLGKHEDDSKMALQALFRVTTSRMPNEDEASLISDLLDQQLNYFVNNPKERDEFLAVGQFKAGDELDKNRLAAMSVVAGMLFNLDESITKR